MRRRPPWAAVSSVARERLRRRGAVTIGLLLLVGLSAAVPMGLWAASRRSSAAYDRFVAAADPADTSLIICPKGLDASGPEGPQPCFSHKATTELRALRRDPHVRGAGRFGYLALDVGHSADPAGLRTQGYGLVYLDGGAPGPTMLGTPHVVSGRLPAPGATDEAMVVEASAKALGVRAGDRIWVRLTGASGPPVPITVTALVRTPDELLPVDREGAFPALLVGPKVLADERAALRTEYGGVAVWLDDGDGAGVARRLAARTGQVVVPVPVLAEDEAATIVQAIDFESRAAAVTAAAAAVVALFLVGQMVSREARSDQADTPTLVTLGLTRDDLVGVGLLRWAPVALGAAALAVVLTVASSTLGPIGVARRGVWTRSLSIDWFVLGAGATAVVVLVLAIGVVASVRSGTRTADPVAAPLPASGSPGVRTGLGLAWHGLRRGAALPLVSAVVTSAIAMATIITAVGGATSLDVVVDDPVRFGAPWDAAVASGDADPGDLAQVEGVAHAAVVGGTEVRIGDQTDAWVQAFFPIPGVSVSRPVLIEGRAPASPDEIALGSQTMERAGVDLGDRVPVVAKGTPGVRRLTVVGRTMVTDGAEPNVGQGGIVTPDGMEEIEVGTDDDAVLAVAISPSADRAAVLADLQRTFPTLDTPFPLPSSLENAQRISRLPLLLALVAALLAAITLAHALIVSVRRNRRELAVCRVLGFTQTQVGSAVSTQATLLAAAAVVLGVPLGVIGARWGWRSLASAFGVAVEPRVPLGVVVACVVGILLLANLTALPTAVAAAAEAHRGGAPLRVIHGRPGSERAAGSTVRGDRRGPFPREVDA